MPRSIRFRTRWRTGGLLATIGTVVLLFSGMASASGSGYNVSYSRAAGSVSNSAVDLTSVSSTDPGGNNITVSFQVSGGLVLNSEKIGYYSWFGGSAAMNSTAWIWLVNNTTTAELYAGASSGPIHFTVGNGGSSATFSVAKAAVGPSSTFAINVYAFALTSGSITYSWLGTNFQNGGGVSCGSATCTTTGGFALLGYWALILVVGIVVIIAVVVLVVVLVFVRGKGRAPPGMIAPSGPAVGPPPPPPPPQAPPPPPPLN